MIKIGKAYFDSDFRWGIFPACSDEQCYIVALESGVKANILVRQEELEQALTAAGLTVDNDQPCDIALPDEELEELSGAYAAGHRYIAKDGRDIVFAFESPPVRDGVYWISTGGIYCRLHGEYSFLDAGDVIDIDTVLV